MRRSWLATLAAVIGAAVPLAGCGRALPTAAQLAGASSGSGATAALSPTTDPPTRQYTQPVVWATYRMVQTIDPIQAFDYPEDTVDTALCDSVLRQNPDGTIGPGLAVATYPTPTELVLNLRSGPTFWDGKPVTAADVAYSLQRAANPKAGGFYPQVFSRVKSIVATTPTEVPLTLKQPDYWLSGELSQMPGIVYEKAYAQKEGKNFGTPQGLTMCSGPFEVKKWPAGQQLVAVANVVRQAATEIGLNVTIKSVSAADFINFFTDASARKGIDMFPTGNYSDYADPAGLYKTLAVPGGTQNYDNFSNPGITNALNLAQSTANPDLRASYVARAGDLIMQQLPWIPLAAPDSLLVTSRQLTGAPTSFVYMGGPWANMMGRR